MEKIIITTVGTSLITNYFEDLRKIGKDADKNAQDYYDKLRNIPYYPINDNTNKGKLLKKVESCSNCAEISSLETIKQELQKEDANVQIKVYLICTDTVLSPLCAGIIKCYLKEPFEVKFEENEEHIIKDLRVDNKELFENTGFEGLMACIDKIATKPKDCILNISGGYKALIPPLTLYGQLKNIPLNYKYEDSSAIIEIGNLPVGIDWSFVEALKPFLNLEFHPLWLNGGKELANAFINGDVYFDKGNNMFRTNNEELEKDIKEKEKVLFVIKHLLDNKLISKKISLTVLGKLLQNVQTLEDYRGYQMEYILYHYFAHCKSDKDKQVQNYQSNAPLKLTGSFKFEDKKLVISNEIKEKPYRAFGDIDVSLIRDGIIVLGESKAFSTFLSYRGDKSGQKYYEQLYARLKRFTQEHFDKINLENPILEMLIIVFQFQFEGFETSILENETVQAIYQKFKAIEKESIEVNEKVAVKPVVHLLGVRCLIKFDNTKSTANYTSFYDKPNFSWEVLN